MRDRAVGCAGGVARQVGLARALLAAACHSGWAHRRAVAVAVLAGLGMAALVYLTAPVFAAVASGACGSALAATCQAGLAARRLAAGRPG